MAFTAAEIQNYTNAALDFHIRSKLPKSQSIQNKPLLSAFEKRKKTFPGGRGNITERVKGDYSCEIQGWAHNDTVSYSNPVNIKVAEYTYKNLHTGIEVTFDELHRNGIRVTETTTGSATSQITGAEEVQLCNLMEDKLEDMTESWARDFNEILWRDGTQDSSVFPGLRYFITNSPSTGTVGGIDRSVSSWWRNRASLNIVASASTQTLTRTLQSEARQLRRYAASPKFIILCGSGFLEDLELELHEKGTYSQTGFANAGKNDIGIAMISHSTLGDFAYDPTLDDLSLDDYCFVIDINAFKLRPIEGLDKVVHTPARPHDQYVLYKSMTWSGALTANQLNSSGVYSTT